MDGRQVADVTAHAPMRGIIDTIAGNGKTGVSVDGQPALEQPLVDPH